MVFIYFLWVSAVRFSTHRVQLVVKLIRPEQRGRYFSVDDARTRGRGELTLLEADLLQYDFRCG